MPVVDTYFCCIYTKSAFCNNILSL